MSWKTPRSSTPIVEDQEQVDKLLEVLPQYPGLKHIFYDDPRGLRNYHPAATAGL